jgi:acetyl esterase
MRAEIDRMFMLFGQPGPPVSDVRDHRVPVEGGEITVRIYHPEASRPVAGRPAIHVLLHGGGWTGGSIDELVSDATARHRAVGAGCVVAAVEYRLAPEHRFPVAVHDVIAAVRWVRDHASLIGADGRVLTLGGASAGANLAAAAVVGADDLGLRALILEVSALDLSRGPVDGPLEEVLSGYLGDRSRGQDPLASPLLEPDPGRFPETVLLAAELDPLRRDSERFAERLSAAGVEVHLTCYKGAMHGSPILTGTWPTARRWQQDVIDHLRRINGSASGASTAVDVVGVI